MDITKMNLQELKAIAYDLIVESERIAKNLQTINKQIEVVLNTPKEEVVEKKK